MSRKWVSWHDEIQPLIDEYRQIVNERMDNVNVCIGLNLIIYAKTKKGKAVRHKGVGRLDAQTRDTSSKS